MQPTPPSELFAILGRLCAAKIRFVVVGGVAGILHGASLTTSDLDVVYDLAADNLEKLVPVLAEIRAHYRDPAGRYIVPDASRLGQYRFNLLHTDLGALDLIQAVSGTLGYADLLPRSQEVEIEGMNVRVLDLETLIESKRFANRPKDLFAILELQRVLELSQQVASSRNEDRNQK